MTVPRGKWEQVVEEPGGPPSMSKTLNCVRIEIASRLRAQRSEIEQAAIARAHAVADPTAVSDPTYALGLHGAIKAAVDYALVSVERGESGVSSVPAAILSQARSAARNGVSVTTVLRRCAAFHTVFGDFLLAAGLGAGSLEEPLRRLLRDQAALYDRVVDAVSTEFAREEVGRARNADQRLAERLKRLLDGESVDVSDLSYEFNVNHLGLVSVGDGAVGIIQKFAADADLQLLLAKPDEQTVWAWLGGRRGIDAAGLERLTSIFLPEQAKLAIGEPAQGLSGWRLTHRQAQATVAVALRKPTAAARYGSNSLLVAMFRDDLLATSLCQQYLMPLECYPDGGETARQTLRAYFAARQNTTSTAAALKVNRRTVAHRISKIEDYLGRSIINAAAEIEATLEFRDLQVNSQPSTCL